MFFWITFFFLFLLDHSQADDLSPQEQEASRAIFDTELGSKDLKLYAQGTWDSRLIFGWGGGFTSFGQIPLLSYPGMEKGFVFQQTPNLNLSLWLMQRYYLEVNYQKDKSTFLLGYQGREKEILQWAKIGNAPISILPRAAHLVSAGESGNPGFGISFAAPFSTHDFLVRYEDAMLEKKIFLGTQEFDDQTLTLDQWIRGQFFRVPVNSVDLPLRDLSVLVQDPNGPFIFSVSTNNNVLDGMRFRVPLSSEIYLDPNRGEIRLFQPSQGVLLVSWASGQTSFTDPLSKQVVQVQGTILGQTGPWYVLYQPGTYSAFELKNHYHLQKSSDKTEIQLVQKDTLFPLEGYFITTGQDQNWLTLTSTTLPAGYPPFWDKYPGIYYGGSKNSPNPITKNEFLQEAIRIRAERSTPPTDLFLGPNVLPGSVIVIRNGLRVPVVGFQVQTGKIDLPVTIFPGDEVIAYYRREKTFQDSTDLSAFQGNQFVINEKQNIETMGSFRWNLKQGRSTNFDMESPGQLQYSVEWKGREESWNWATGITVHGLLTDSTGYRSLYGMDQKSTQIILDSTSLRPSSAPYVLAPYSTGSPASSLDHTRRGTTYYRHYWTTDAFTGLPSLSLDTKAGISQENYGPEGYIGPYLMLGDGIRTGRLVVLESLLDNEEWSGFHVYFDAGREKDLSSTTRIQLSLRLVQDLPPGARIFFQAGSLGNDLDGTQTVLPKTVSKWPGITWTNRRDGWNMIFPIPEDSNWTNNTQGTPVIRPTGSLVTRELTQAGDLAEGTTFSSTNTQWQDVIFTLSDDERSVLKNATGWRVFIVNQGTPWNNIQSVYTESAEFFGTNLGLTENTSTKDVFFVELPESRAQKKADRSLKESFEEISDVFYSDQSEPKVLQASWSQGAFKVQGRHNPLRFSSYNKIVLYYRLDPSTTGSPHVTLTLCDINEKGLRAEWQPRSNTTWSKLVIDLQKKEFLSQETGSIQIDHGSEFWDRMTLSIDGSLSGLLYIAEIHCEEPLWEFNGNWRAESSWYQQDPFPSKQFPLVSGTKIRAASQLSVSSMRKFSWLGSSDLQINLGPSRWTWVTSLLTEQARYQFHGAYTFTLPLGPIELKEEFSDRGSRSNEIVLVGPYLGRFLVNSRLYGPPMMLRQRYSLIWNDLLKPMVPETWKITLKHLWQQDWLEQIPLEPFGQQWLQSWTWYLPREGLPQFVQLQHEGTIETSDLPVGFNLHWKLQTSQTPGWQLSPFWFWEMALPYRQQARDGIWNFQQKIVRRLSLTDKNTQGYSSLDLCRISMERLLSIPWGFIGLPFQEQFFFLHAFTDQPETLSTGSLESQSITTLQRPRSLYWTDLVIPLQTDITIQTKKIRENRSLIFFQEAQLKLFTQGLNQFGRSGVHPFFAWYETDEWSWSIDTSVSDGEKIDDKKWSLRFLTFGKILFTLRESLSLPISLDGTWSQKNKLTIETTPVWEIRLPAKLPFDLPRWISPKDFPREFIHRATWKVRLSWDNDLTTPILEKIYMEYQGILKITQDGEIALWLRWGNEWKNNLYLTGVELSLKFKMSY